MVIFVGAVKCTDIFYGTQNHRQAFLPYHSLQGHGCTVKSALNEMTMVAEGYYASACMKKINDRHNVYMPIADMVYDILYCKASPRKKMKELTAQL